MKTSLSPTNFIGTILALCVLALAVTFAISKVDAGTKAQATANDHTCVAPCIVKFAPGTQEDEVAWDYRHGGTVAVTRACDHYCFEALTQARRDLGANLCADFGILPVLTEPGDRWPVTCK
jgi:hypothetical protein